VPWRTARLMHEIFLELTLEKNILKIRLLFPGTVRYTKEGIIIEF
jgi:hypothetical protein